jgi:serine/threonine-protein kinase
MALQAQGAGVTGDLLDILIVQKLLTSEQAEKLRIDIHDASVVTSIDVVPTPVTPPPAPEKNGHGLPAPKAAVPPTRSGYHLCSIGGHRLLRRLGEGGMGTVYLAYSESLQKQVAIKVLADRLATNSSYVDRFLREARNGTRLDHPNVVRCIEAGKDEASGKHFLMMEYVDGPSARALLDRQGRLPVGDAVHIIVQIARALRYVHARDFVHRDIKPDNILINSAGVAKLADLGLAKCIADASQLTGAKQGFGTPYYMPCEQAVDATKADARCDIYALGATLYHLITGVVPFPGETHLQIAERKLAGTYLPASGIIPAVAPLDPIIAKMLARDPNDRYADANDLIQDLKRTGLDLPTTPPAKPVSEEDSYEVSRSPDEMTQVDLEVSPTPPARTDVWYVRYRELDGEWCSLRATTEQVLQRLKASTLPATSEVSRTPRGEFRPAAAYPEFRELRARRTPTPPPAPASFGTNGRTPAPPPSLPPAPAAIAPLWGVVLGVSLAVLAGAAAAALYFMRHS